MSRMRHAVTWILASVAMSCGTASAAHAQLTAADSARFVRVTQSLLDAITHGDSSVWAPHLAPEWFIIDEEGNRYTRAGFLPTLRGLPPGQSGVLRVAGWHLVGEGDVAVMSYDIDEKHDYYGQHLRTRFHATDTWLYRDGGWRMLASQVTALPTRAAGRPLPRELLDDYVGTYALTDEITLEIVVADSGLQMVRGRGRQGSRCALPWNGASPAPRPLPRSGRTREGMGRARGGAPHEPGRSGADGPPKSLISTRPYGDPATCCFRRDPAKFSGSPRTANAPADRHRQAHIIQNAETGGKRG